MIAARSRRQSIRRALILCSFLLFPIIINFFSPYLIIDSASQGIVNGSMIVFGTMFLGSLFLGRLWCGWGCPMAGLGETCFAINDRPIRSHKLDRVKWVLWVLWISGIAAAAWSAGGYRQVNVFYLMENYISIDRPAGFIIYYFVIALFMTLALTLGRRGGCHTVCWMAPFMILGRKIRNQFAWPALRLEAEPSRCQNCKQCTAHCPMSLDVNSMVRQGRMENSECSLCGTCIDGCPAQVIRYTFKAGN